MRDVEKMETGGERETERELKTSGRECNARTEGRKYKIKTEIKKYSGQPLSYRTRKGEEPP